MREVKNYMDKEEMRMVIVENAMSSTNHNFKEDIYDILFDLTSYIESNYDESQRKRFGVNKIQQIIIAYYEIKRKKNK